MNQRNEIRGDFRSKFKKLWPTDLQQRCKEHTQGTVFAGNGVGKLAVYMQKNETRPLLFIYKGPTENNQISD